jgi:hypothetical protein
VDLINEVSNYRLTERNTNHITPSCRLQSVVDCYGSLGSYKPQNMSKKIG